MQTVVGPILARAGGYAFDAWTPEEGLSRGYTYRRIEDAHYARNVAIRSDRRGRSDGRVVCSTAEEFDSAVAEREGTFRALVANLGVLSVEAADPLDRRAAPIAIVHGR
jgi:hypothetical protein